MKIHIVGGDNQMNLEEAIKKYQDRLGRNDILGTPLWEYYGVARKIAQAACNYGGYIVTGTRHFCPIMNLQIDSIGRYTLMEWAGGRSKIVEGFTCQYGHFLTRQEAYIVAKKAGQIRPDREHLSDHKLYSEMYI